MPMHRVRMVRRKKTAAERADKYRLYEKAVQNPEAEVEFISTTFRQLRGRRPWRLREDFCGTAAICCEWVRRRRGNEALGIDLDPEVLAWSQRHRVPKLKNGQQQRLRLLNADVLGVQVQRTADVIAAFNFSYWIFADRRRMLDYFRGVYQGLTEDGLFFLDAFGGAEAVQTQKEVTRFKKFRYIWDQAEYDPISGMQTCHINFRFPDGSRLEPAFSYRWRVWTLPEIRELLEEAGFSRVTFYWEGTDPRTGEGDGLYKPAERGEADPAWVVYILAARS